MQDKNKKYHKRFARIFPDIDFSDPEQKKKLSHIYKQVRRVYMQKVNREKAEYQKPFKQLGRSPTKEKIYEAVADSVTAEHCDLGKRGTVVIDLGKIIPEYKGVDYHVKIKRPDSESKRMALLELLKMKQFALNGVQMDTEIEFLKLKKKQIKVGSKANILYDSLLVSIKSLMEDIKGHVSMGMHSESELNALNKRADTLLKLSQVLKKAL